MKHLVQFCWSWFSPLFQGSNIIWLLNIIPFMPFFPNTFANGFLSLTGACLRLIQRRLRNAVYARRTTLFLAARFPRRSNIFKRVYKTAQRVLSSHSLSGITVAGIAGRGASFNTRWSAAAEYVEKRCRPKRKLGGVKIINAATLIPRVTSNRGMGFIRVR